MLTIFSIPKPFEGHIGIIQRNAIQSWMKLRPSCQIVLFGSDKGVKETAEEFGLTHIPEIPCNEYGTPLLDWVFDKARSLANHKLMCYVNGDIILTSDLLQSVNSIPYRKFLAVGLRWDMDITQPLDFSDNAWEAQLRQDAGAHATPYGPYALDYFIFPKQGMNWNMPPFAVGRPGWDHWMVYRALQLRSPVIDLSNGTKAIHQNHNYNHVPKSTGNRWEGPEANINRSYFDPRVTALAFSMTDVTHHLVNGQVCKIKTREAFLRRIATLPVIFPWTAKPIAIALFLKSKGKIKRSNTAL